MKNVLAQHRITIEALRVSNIPKRYWPITPEDIAVQPKTLRFLSTYLDHLMDEDRGIFITGESRTGKTSAMCLILRGALARDYSTRFITLGELVDLYFDRKEEGDRTYREFVEAQCVGLDDIAKNENKGYSQVLSDFFRARSNAALCTVICANVDEAETDEIASEYGEEMSSRIRDHSYHLHLHRNHKYARNAKKHGRI